jgi:hypothetical protein
MNKRTKVSSRSFALHFCHLPAGGRTASAGFCTGFHSGIVSELLTALRALLADLHAKGAGPSMKVGVAKHKVCARLANVGAIEQQTNMIRRRMFPPHLQAVCCGL